MAELVIAGLVGIMTVLSALFSMFSRKNQKLSKKIGRLVDGKKPKVKVK